MSVSRVTYYINPNQLDSTGLPIKQAVVYYYPENVTEIWQKPSSLLSEPGQETGDQFNYTCNKYFPSGGPFQVDSNPGWTVPAAP
jgi:hypothetical protein